MPRSTFPQIADCYTGPNKRIRECPNYVSYNKDGEGVVNMKCVGGGKTSTEHAKILRSQDKDIPE